MADKKVIMLPSGEVGPTIAQLAYLDQYKSLKAIGLNMHGELDFNPDRATKRRKAYYKNAVDISDYGLWEYQGIFFIEPGKNSGSRAEIRRGKDGVVRIANGEGARASDELMEIYTLAEMAFKHPYDFA